MKNLVFLIILLWSFFAIVESVPNITYAVIILSNNASNHSLNYCARYVASALQLGGFVFEKQKSAYLYRTNGILEKMGFIEIKKPSSFNKGDISLTMNNADHPHGHIAMWNGSNWVSDFVQKSEYVYKVNQPRIYYYRYANIITNMNSVKTCEKEDIWNCSSVYIEAKEFQNYKCKAVGSSCTIVPKDEKNQEKFIKITNGENKEMASKNYEKYASGFYGTFSEEDKAIIENKNTCSYISFGSFYETGNIGISDKNKCFNAEQFNDLKGLIDCGYGEVSINYKGVINNINLCYYIPGPKMDNELMPYFKYHYIDKITKNDLKAIFEQRFINRNLEGEETIEDEQLTYEIIVEDKDGNKVKYTESNFEINFISKKAYTPKSDEEKINDSRFIKASLIKQFYLYEKEKLLFLL